MRAFPILREKRNALHQFERRRRGREEDVHAVMMRSDVGRLLEKSPDESDGLKSLSESPERSTRRRRREREEGGREDEERNKTNISSARIAPVPSTFRRAMTHSYMNLRSEKEKGKKELAGPRPKTTKAKLRRNRMRKSTNLDSLLLMRSHLVGENRIDDDIHEIVVPG